MKYRATAHKGQMAVHTHPARFKVLAAGRRWGKTRLGVNECISVAANGGRAWWVAPSYKMSEVGWRPLKNLGSQLGAEVKRVDRRLEFAGGGEIAVRSADNPDSLRGESLNLVVMDECAFTKEAAWIEALRPALSDRRGKALFISTPKGRDWFWRLFQAGTAGDNDFMSWRFPTSSNPYIDKKEIEAAKKSLPSRVFSQEYEAEFLDDAGGVFRNVMQCAWAVEQNRAIDGHEYIIGIDWGKLNDFTVISVYDLTLNHIVYLDRFNQIDYQFQLARVLSAVERFRPLTIYAESNSMGEALIDQLRYTNGLPVVGMKATNATKDAWIQALSIAFEKEEIAIPNDPVAIGEFQAFEAQRLPSGLMRYSAPDGMHDDIVMSVAIVNAGARRAGEAIEVHASPFFN